MSNQLKSGDLALTLADGFDWPAGIVVTLSCFVPIGYWATETSGFRWKAEHDQWVVLREGDPIADCYRPEHLMPLRGDFAPEQQKAREVTA